MLGFHRCTWQKCDFHRCALQKYWIFAGCTLQFWRVGSQKCWVFIGAPCKIVEFWPPALRKWIVFEGCTLWKFNSFERRTYENSTILTASPSKMNHFWRMHSTRTYLFERFLRSFATLMRNCKQCCETIEKTICFCSFWASRSPYAITLTNYQRGKKFWVTDN
jgi:hypothetical protein